MYGLMNARGVHKNNLCLWVVLYSQYPVSGCLLPVCNNGDLLAQYSIQKRRLPDIGFADDGNIAAAKVLRNILQKPFET